MPPKLLATNWSSVSAAAAMLLGLGRAEASGGDLPSIDESKRGDGDPFEPLILKAAPTQMISEQLFAAHGSHSSHSSHASASSGGGAGHASHYSGTTGGTYYTPPIPPAPPTSTFPPATPLPIRRATPVYPSGISAAPVPQQIVPYVAPVTQTPIRIELTNGAALYGTVLVKSAAGITFRGLDEKNYKIPRILLSASTIAALALPAEQASATSSTTP